MQLCEDSASGVRAAAATQAYSLLREGAGKLAYLSDHALPRLPPTASQDCDPEVRLRWARA